MSFPRLPLATLLACLACLVAMPAGAQAPSPSASAGETFSLTLPADAHAAPGAGQGGSVQFIGTATVLIRYQGFTILTDPNFLHKGDVVHLGYGIKSTRLTDPAVDLDKLPPIDLVVLSHMHEDHFDRFVQTHLDKRVPIVTTKEASAALRRLGFTRAYGLSTWDAVAVDKGAARLRITAVPGRHGNDGMQWLLPAMMGSVLDFGPDPAAPDYRMYVSGDTLIYGDLNAIPQRFPGVDLAMLHLGGTRILGVFKVTMDGKDGVKLMQIVQPRRAIPIHYDDYDVFKSPLSDFAREVQAAGLASLVTYLAHGATYAFTPDQH